MTVDEKRVRIEVRLSFEQYEMMAKLSREKGYPSVGELIEGLIAKALTPTPESLLDFPSEGEF